jgi:hypothetical protein
VRAAITLLLLAGCTTYGSEVERIRQGLIGMKARSLSRCLPVPAEVQPAGGVEVVIYRWNLEPGEELYPVAGGPRGPADPVRTESRQRREESDFLLTGERPDETGYCEISVEVADGVIQAVRVEGRESSGLNRDAACVMEARACVPREDGRS